MSIDSKSRAVGWMIAGLAMASMAVHAAGPVARWTFEVGEGAVELKKGASVLTFGAHGKCLRLADGSSRAVARTDAKTPDIADAAKPYTVMLWLKPDGGLVGDNMVKHGEEDGAAGDEVHVDDERRQVAPPRRRRRHGGRSCVGNVYVRDHSS